MRIEVKGSSQRMKGNESFKDGGFEQVPHTIFNYLKLGLIKGNDLTVYLFLYKNDNREHGYAFPNIKQIALDTGLSDKTVKACTKNLEQVRLIRKEKSKTHPNKNVYYVDLPLSKVQLYRQVPEAVKQYEERKTEFDIEARNDKERLTTYLDENKGNQNPEINARSIQPSIIAEEEPDYIKQEREAIRQMEVRRQKLKNPNK